MKWLWFFHYINDFLLDCGNHPGHKATSSSSKRLGTVKLATGETHLSCRRHCQTSYPAFRYYHQFMANNKECVCFTDEEEVIQIEKSHDTNFGYADSCGKANIYSKKSRMEFTFSRFFFLKFLKNLSICCYMFNSFSTLYFCVSVSAWVLDPSNVAKCI